MLDMRDLMTVPSMENGALLDAYMAAAVSLTPHISTNRPTTRYRVSA